MPPAGGEYLAELMREMAVMKKLDHPNLVKLHEVIHDVRHNKLVRGSGAGGAGGASGDGMHCWHCCW